MSTEPPNTRGRLVVVAIVAFVAVTAAGFFSGTRHAPTPVHSGGGSLRTEPSEADVPRHRDIGRERRGPNADLYAEAFDGLTGAVPSRTQPVELGDRDEAVAARAERRAYDGAPPTIPHAVEQRGAPTCLACHEHGARIGDRVARAMSHELHTSCVQCHVVAADPRPVPRVDRAVPNDFVGLASSGAGPRAWQGAPPQMPHGTAMRENCISCHGPAGHPGLRTTHPERDNCLQCHTAAADGVPRFPVEGSEGSPPPAGGAR